MQVGIKAFFEENKGQTGENRSSALQGVLSL